MREWHYVPLFSLAEHYSEASWFFFTNEETQVDFETLWTVLGRFDKTKASNNLVILVLTGLAVVGSFRSGLVSWSCTEGPKGDHHPPLPGLHQ